MKEKLYTIPVNDAFARDVECPVCAMYKTLEDNAVDYTMGPSYMEDDVRMETDRLGFCKGHMQMLLTQQNKLGLALILKTHFDKTIKDAKKLSATQVKPNGLLKKAVPSPVIEYTEKMVDSCFICDRINLSFQRYLKTVVQMWKQDDAFRTTYSKCKGFCTEHYGALVKEAQNELNAEQLNQFMQMTSKLYLDNMQRLADDLEWFTDKFDYRYKDEPWRNSKDAIPRAVIKSNGLIESEEKK